MTLGISPPYWRHPEFSDKVTTGFWSTTMVGSPADQGEERVDLQSFMWWTDVAKLAPLATAVTALVAAWLALRSLRAQKSIARKRAAIDFFLKADMDEKMIQANDRYRDAFIVYQKEPSMSAFAETKDFRDIQAYLNIHEMMAIGVLRKVFDEGVCYHYWSSQLEQTCRDMRELIPYICRTNGDDYSYKQLLALNTRWCKHRRFWQGWRD
jgi:competence protein ComGF